MYIITQFLNFDSIKNKSDKCIEEKIVLMLIYTPRHLPTTKSYGRFIVNYCQYFYFGDC